MKKTAFLFSSIIISLFLAGYASLSAAQTTEANFQASLSQLRQSRQALKDAKAQEVVKATEEANAKTQAVKLAVQQKRQAAQVLREEKRQQVLLKLVDIQIKWMNRTNERVQNMPNISAELKTQLAAEVGAVVVKLNDLKTRIEAASGQEAIKALAKEVRDFFKSKHEVVKKIVEAIHASRAANVVTKAEERASAIKVKAQALKDKGKDTAKVEVELNDADDKIAKAKEAIGKKAFLEANEDIKGAYQNFRNIAQKAKGL